MANTVNAGRPMTPEEARNGMLLSFLMLSAAFLDRLQKFESRVVDGITDEAKDEITNQLIGTLRSYSHAGQEMCGGEPQRLREGVRRMGADLGFHLEMIEVNGSEQAQSIIDLLKQGKSEEEVRAILRTMGEQQRTEFDPAKHADA